MAYDVRSEEFWKEENLHGEFLRVAGVCRGCRLCAGLCPAFRELFRAIDDSRGGWSTGLRKADRCRVADLCFHCRLCHVTCPFTAEKGHAHEIDFPRLMLRTKFVRVRTEGLPFRSRLLANPELIGAVGGLTAPFSNWAGRQNLTRLIMEKALCVDRRRRLPKFHRTTFDRWYRKREKRLRKRVRGTGGKAALFHTCSVNYNRPEIGKSVIAILAHNDVETVCPEQRCCGMHYLLEGDLEGALQNVEFNVRSLRRFAGMGYTIVAMQPSCSSMLKVEYPWIDDGPHTRAVSEATMDLSEYLMSLHQRRNLDRKFDVSPGKMLYHVSCHLRAQGIGDVGRDLLKLIPGIEIETLEGCSGMGERWGMSKKHYEASLNLARPVLERVDGRQDEWVVSDCVRAGLQVRHGVGRDVLHPAEVLRYAYGLSLDV